MQSKTLIGLMAVVLALGSVWYFAKTKQKRTVIELPRETVFVKSLSVFKNNRQKTSQETPPPLTKPTISFISPSIGDEWVVGLNHLIKWSQSAGATGGIYLTAATPGQEVIGWIISETGPSQKSYDWNTRDVAIGRYGGVKKSVLPGLYLLKLVFDDRRGQIFGAPFRIIYPEEIKKASHAIDIFDFRFSPSIIAIGQGDDIVFTNKGSVIHRIISSSFGPFTIKSGESFTFDTAKLEKGNYSYYDDVYLAMTGNVVVASQ